MINDEPSDDAPPTPFSKGALTVFRQRAEELTGALEDHVAVTVARTGALEEVEAHEESSRRLQAAVGAFGRAELDWCEAAWFAAPQVDDDGGVHWHQSFAWPDVVWDVLRTGAEVPGLYLSDGDPDASAFASSPEHGCFVRVLLTVQLDDGSTTYRTWLQVSQDDHVRAFNGWVTPPVYEHLVLEGRLANDVPPGQVLGAHARAVVVDVDQLPRIEASNDSVLARLLTERWAPHLHGGA